jgi:hypothetical protein
MSYLTQVETLDKQGNPKRKPWLKNEALMAITSKIGNP